MTLREAIAEAATRIAAQADLRDNAARDAELLLLHVLGARRTVLFTDGTRTLREADKAAYEALIARRQLGEPIQYIVGEQEFYGLTLKVTPAVLIPRPETELLVQAALERLPKDRVLRIADVGTGSGAIALAIAFHLPLARVTALDLSQAALAVAQDNASRLGVGDRVRLMYSDLMTSVENAETFDAVLSNPPYVAAPDRGSLHRQVREFEPEMALFAGVKGLDVYRRLIPAAVKRLVPGGLLAMEIGYGQQSAILGMMEGWDALEVLKDLQGIPRVVLGRNFYSEVAG